MFIKHNHLIINTSNINYIAIRESSKQLIVHFNGDNTTTLKFESSELMEEFCKILNE